jgi:hypothetical protein
MSEKYFVAGFARGIAEEMRKEAVSAGAQARAAYGRFFKAFPSKPVKDVPARVKEWTRRMEGAPRSVQREFLSHINRGFPKGKKWYEL